MQSVEVDLEPVSSTPTLPPRRSSNDFFDGADVSPDGVVVGGPLSDDDSAQSPPEPPPRSTGEAPAPEPPEPPPRSTGAPEPPEPPPRSTGAARSAAAPGGTGGAAVAAAAQISRSREAARAAVALVAVRAVGVDGGGRARKPGVLARRERAGAASSSWDGTARLWSLERPGAPAVATLRHACSRVAAVALTDHLLALGGADGAILACELPSAGSTDDAAPQTPPRRRSKPPELPPPACVTLRKPTTGCGVAALAWVTPKALLSGGASDDLTLLKLPSASLLPDGGGGVLSTSVPIGGYDGSAGVGPTRALAAAGGAVASLGASAACLWDLEPLRPKRVLLRHGSAADGEHAGRGARALSVDSGGYLVAVGFTDGGVALLDARAARPAGALRMRGGGIVDLAFVETHRLAACVAADERVWVWDLRRSRAPACDVELAESCAPVVALAAAPGGVLTGGDDRVVRLWRRP